MPSKKVLFIHSNQNCIFYNHCFIKNTMCGQKSGVRRMSWFKTALKHVLILTVRPLFLRGRKR
ncbi:hypothetical protein AAJ76_1630001028 [Vairimorpha ceranae]|uniref:Uncharacterized protein n=1 Tax=Vairimorpha ceranae TaxID=40302 RepID=A0A0F9WLJ9_9MICR|nr:hypothetical protein AAJ76_1630001028 [Vairimorpha ceranae]KKO73953.1 hypothetical protein AAJ76_1630001028 [Vairimorpha ceranae]